MRSNWEIHVAFTDVKRFIEETGTLTSTDDYTTHHRERMALLEKHLSIYFPGATLPGPFANLLFDPFAANFDWLLVHVDSLEKSEIENLVDEALVRSQSLLPGFKGAVYVIPGAHPGTTNNVGLKTFGISGDTKRSYIRLYIGPVEDWQSWLITVVAHEYNHYVRLQTVQANTLRDRLIYEGLAEAYSRAIVPEMITPYTDADFISTDDMRRVWQFMFPKLEIVDNTVILGQMAGGDKDYSFLSQAQKVTLGYTVGHQIVQSYINRRYVQNGQAIDWLEITQLDAATILNLSDFAYFN